MGAMRREQCPVLPVPVYCRRHPEKNDEELTVFSTVSTNTRTTAGERAAV